MARPQQGGKARQISEKARRHVAHRRQKREERHTDEHRIPKLTTRIADLNKRR